MNRLSEASYKISVAYGKELKDIYTLVDWTKYNWNFVIDTAVGQDSIHEYTLTEVYNNLRRSGSKIEEVIQDYASEQVYIVIYVEYEGITIRVVQDIFDYKELFGKKPNVKDRSDFIKKWPLLEYLIKRLKDIASLGDYDYQIIHSRDNILLSSIVKDDELVKFLKDNSDIPNSKIDTAIEAAFTQCRVYIDRNNVVDAKYVIERGVNIELSNKSYYPVKAILYNNMQDLLYDNVKGIDHSVILNVLIYGQVHSFTCTSKNAVQVVLDIANILEDNVYTLRDKGIIVWNKLRISRDDHVYLYKLMTSDTKDDTKVSKKDTETLFDNMFSKVLNKV